MKLQHVIISIIITSLIILGATIYMGSLGDSYGVTANMSAFNNTKAALDNQTAIAKSLASDITNIELESGPVAVAQAVFDVPYTMIKVAWKSAKLMFGSFVTSEAVITDSVTAAGESGIDIPDYLIGSIVAILAISLIAMLIYAFFKWKFED